MTCIPTSEHLQATEIGITDDIQFESMVMPEGLLFGITIPDWIAGRSLASLHLRYRHGVLVLRVDDEWGPDPDKAFVGGEHLLVGFTDAAVSTAGEAQRDNVDEDEDWLRVREWLHQESSAHQETVPLISIAHPALEGKELAAIDLQRKFGFAPKVIGISRSITLWNIEEAGFSTCTQRKIEWFPGGSSVVKPDDQLLCHADALDLQLLEPRLNCELETVRRHEHLRYLIAQARDKVERQKKSPAHCRSEKRPLSRSVSPITPRSSKKQQEPEDFSSQRQDAAWTRLRLRSRSHERRASRKHRKAFSESWYRYSP